MQAKRIIPEVGKHYRNRGGGTFRCLSNGQGYSITQNTASGWTFDAYGIREYADGSIEWDYSLNGFFMEN